MKKYLAVAAMLSMPVAALADGTPVTSVQSGGPFNPKCTMIEVAGTAGVTFGWSSSVDNPAKSQNENAVNISRVYGFPLYFHVAAVQPHPDCPHGGVISIEALRY